MWDTLTLPARGNFSLRKIACSFLAVFVSAFLLTVLYSTAAHAADATWKEDGTVEYAGKIYQQETPVPEGMADIPAGSLVFLAKDEQQKTASALIIPATADQTKEIPNVTVINYTLTQDGGLTNAQRPPNDTITLTARPAPKNKTQCDVAGVGWIICTVSRFIAGGMDIIFDLIANYLTVEPISTNTESGLHQAWSIALGLANLVFILAFLMIIYAHISSYGISNYNLKKMIPKLIVAAILVNLSYYICAIAVDLSNILGRSVQEALIQIRQSLPGTAGGALDVFSWKNITEYILSGGTIVAGVFAAKAAILGGSAAASISGMTFLLFPILVAGVLAVLIALVVLAARQALITVLIVIAPLAFVAYILPNTEKWFEKWRDLFTTMLMVFPLFSLLFGGSQLASAIVLQNTDQLSVALFAMFIQVAPLALTPFLVKFSGSLLGRLAGMINDPKRGIVDRARGWATEKAEVQGAKGIAAAQKGGGTFMQRAAYRRQLDKKNREGWKKTGEGAVEAGWAWDSRAHRHHAAHAELGLVKESGESQSKRHYEELRSRNRNLQRYAGRLRANNEAISALQTSEDAAWERAKTGQVEPGNQFAQFSNDARTTQLAQNIAQRQVKLAQSVASDEFTKMALANESVQAEIGIVGGAERALANISAEYRKNYNERVAEGEQLLKHFNLSGPQRQALALGGTLRVSDSEGNLRTFGPDQQYIHEAAIDLQMRQGTLAEVEQIIEQSGVSLKGYTTTMAQAMADRGASKMAVYLGGQTINDVGQGKIAGREGLDNAFVTTLLKGKVSAADLATGDVDGLKRMVRVLNAGPPPGLDPAKQAAFMQKAIEFKQAAFNALTDSNLKGSVKGNSKEVLVGALRSLGGEVRDDSGAVVSDLDTRTFS